MKKRLNKLCDLVEGRVVADVGCDHGYLCEMLLCKDVDKIYACEVTQNNLEKAKSNITNYVHRKFENVESGENKLTFGDRAVEFVLSDGFNNLQIVPDCAIMAGMGGELIVDILFRNPNKLPDVVVLQPMSKLEYVRTRLAKHYEIVEDSVLYDCGKFYNVIKAKRGKDKLTSAEVLFGKTNLQVPTQEFMQYLDKIKRVAKEIKTKQYEDLLVQIEKVEEMYEQNFRIPKN